MLDKTRTKKEVMKKVKISTVAEKNTRYSQNDRLFIYNGADQSLNRITRNNMLPSMEVGIPVGDYGCWAKITLNIGYISGVEIGLDFRIAKRGIGKDPSFGFLHTLLHNNIPNYINTVAYGGDKGKMTAIFAFEDNSLVIYISLLAPFGTGYFKVFDFRNNSPIPIEIKSIERTESAPSTIWSIDF